MNNTLQESPKKIIIIIGKALTGKTTLASKLVNHLHIETSTVVKKISGEVSRAGLQNTGSFDTLIAQDIIDTLSSDKPYVITGIRQLSILKMITDTLSADEYEIVLLEVPMEELKRRYINRHEMKDDLVFEDIIERDDTLGLKELEAYLYTKEQYPVTILQNY